MSAIRNTATPAPDHRQSISVADARALLKSIDGLKFGDPSNFQPVFDALDELAWWGEAEHNNKLAIEWIKRIYDEVQVLPYDNALYGKGLRRLRTLCGRTSNLPAICEVEDTFEHSNVAIAQTGISDVYRAVNAQNKQQVVALKRIRDNATSVAALKRVWRKEAIVWQLLRHPHIVPFLGILRQDSSLQLVSTWMAHGQLTQYIKAHPEESPLRFIRHVIAGLEHVHSLGMVHGDIKGENILVDDEYNARICDFGVSVTSHQTGLATQPGSRGTAAYKAPETIDWGEDDAATYLPTCASDVYATTVHIWELYAGHKPYPSTGEFAIYRKTCKGDRMPREGTHRLKDPHMDSLWEVMQRGWATNPTERCTLKEMDDVVQELEQKQVG